MRQDGKVIAWLQLLGALLQFREVVSVKKFTRLLFKSISSIMNSIGPSKLPHSSTLLSCLWPAIAKIVSIFASVYRIQIVGNTIQGLQIAWAFLVHTFPCSIPRLMPLHKGKHLTISAPSNFCRCRALTSLSVESSRNAKPAKPVPR